jgi:pyruvate,water dikinase
MPRQSKLINPLNPKKLGNSGGNKANNIAALQNAGFCVPQTWVCTWKAFERYQKNDVSVVEELKNEVEELLIPGKRYAVRSSANFEDDVSQSFAGQFKTVLDVDTPESAMQAIWSIWATSNSQPVQDYLQKHFRKDNGLKMAVIIQEMINPVISGVSFSKNPMTGMDEVLVEAVEGRGDQLVQEGVTPYRWIWKWGFWLKRAECETAPIELIEKVVEGTREISRHFNSDLDLEWVFDGHQLYWLQMRQITSIQGVSVYSNKLAKEMLPGLVKPLVWSINIPLVNGAWVRMLTELIGNNDLTPEKLAKAFHYRTYFNMGILGDVFSRLGMPRESLEMMMGMAPDGYQSPKMKPNLKMMRLLPNLLMFMVDKLTFKQKINQKLPKLEARFQSYHREDWEEMDDGQLLRAIDELFDIAQEMAYFNIVGPLLMMFYNGSLRSQLKKVDVDFNQVRVVEGMQELKQYDPVPHIKDLNYRYRKMPDAEQKKIAQFSFTELIESDEAADFGKEVEKFIRHFGHLSDSGNDFSCIPWREDPNTLFKMILHYEPEQELLEERITFDSIPLRGMHRWILRHIYRRARDFRLFRERISFRYTYGYGLFRNYFLELGKRFVSRGWLQDASDIFYLYLAEIKATISGDSLGKDLLEVVEKRKEEMENAKNVTLPQIIFGEDIPPVDQEGKKALKGVGTSGGYFEGTAKVVCGLRDFQKIETGDVLIIPYSDVSWTPLFAKAGAVVSESGGMLSHSSIIAREYRIPCVVSVHEATFVKDGTRLLVNGYSGDVIFVEGTMEASK